MNQQHQQIESIPTPIVAAFSLKEWRTSQLAQVKRTLAYQALAPIQRRIVDHIIRRYLSPRDGAFPKQATLAQRFGVCRETINRHMREILSAGIFIASPRYRGAGTPGGRTSNRLFINPDLLSDATTTEGADVTQPVTQPLTQPVTAEGSNQIEGRSHVEALPSLETEEQVEGRSQLEESSGLRGSFKSRHAEMYTPVAIRDLPVAIGDGLASAPDRTGAEIDPIGIVFDLAGNPHPAEPLEYDPNEGESCLAGGDIRWCRRTTCLRAS